jgi:hypothetical protein
MTPHDPANTPISGKEKRVQEPIPDAKKHQANASGPCEFFALNT